MERSEILFYHDGKPGIVLWGKEGLASLANLIVEPGSAVPR